MKKILIFLSLLYIVYALPKSAFAQTVPQQFLQVSPIIQDITLTPGKTFTYPLTITNKGDKPVGFHIDVTDIDPTADETTAHILHSPLVAWISTTPQDLIVAAHQTNKFTIKIATPKNAPTAGYYATLFLTPFISNPPKVGGPVILERIGALIFATVGRLDYQNLAQKSSISNFSFVHSLTGKPTAIEFKVTNKYFTHFIAKPFLSMTSLTGTKTTLSPVEKHVLPGSTRTWTYPVTMPWYTIYATSDLAVSIGSGYQLTASTTFINYTLILYIVGSICLVLFILKRAPFIKKAISVLFVGHE